MVSTRSMVASKQNLKNIQELTEKYPGIAENTEKYNTMNAVPIDVGSETFHLYAIQDYIQQLRQVVADKFAYSMYGWDGRPGGTLTGQSKQIQALFSRFDGTTKYSLADTVRYIIRFSEDPEFDFDEWDFFQYYKDNDERLNYLKDIKNYDAIISELQEEAVEEYGQRWTKDWNDWMFVDEDLNKLRMCDDDCECCPN